MAVPGSYNVAAFGDKINGQCCFEGWMLTHMVYGNQISLLDGDIFKLCSPVSSFGTVCCMFHILNIGLCFCAFGERYIRYSTFQCCKGFLLQNCPDNCMHHILCHGKQVDCCEVTIYYHWK